MQPNSQAKTLDQQTGMAVHEPDIGEPIKLNY